MIYLIKIIFLIFISFSTFANSNEVNEIIFKINNKVFTNIDLEKRIEYIALTNNLTPNEISNSEKEQIFNDFISSLIFYEYYMQNKIVFKNLNEEIELLYNTYFQNAQKLDETQIKKYKLNSKIDLIRKKIIEKNLNSMKETLLQEVNKLDLLYNYNLQNIIIKENLIDKNLINNIDNRNKFIDLKNFLKENNINFFYKEEDINDNTIISNKIKKIINENIKIYKKNDNGYINLISIKKNFESYEGIFVKLINFKTSMPFKKKDLQCNKINETIDINKTIFKEYEYSKLNNNIKNNLKSINDYVLFKENDEYNYIVLCDLSYDENLLKNINFNKNVNSLVNKIQKQFLKKYKNEYKFSKVK